MTKPTNFLLVRAINSTYEYASLFIHEIVPLRGVPLSIILDRGDYFTSQFWNLFQKGIGSGANLNTAFHYQTDGQVEYTIHILKDMLRACVLDLQGYFYYHLPLIEFAHNNKYHSNIRMTLYEARYG